MLKVATDMRWYPWLLLAILIASLLPSIATPHGSADWIMQEPGNCCGPRDCHRVDVRAAPGGWEILGIAEDGTGEKHFSIPKGIVIPFDKVTAKAQRPGFWACFYTRQKDGGWGNPTAELVVRDSDPVRCFFTPEAET